MFKYGSVSGRVFADSFKSEESFLGLCVKNLDPLHGVGVWLECPPSLGSLGQLKSWHDTLRIGCRRRFDQYAGDS